MITVGVAAFNSAETLPGLLDSLLTQQYPLEGFEVVIADNGSTDATAAVVREYAARGPVRLVPARRRRGPAVARNAVIAAARGEIVAFTDSDCLAHPYWLREIEPGFSDANVGCVAGAIVAGEPQSPTERYYARHKILSQDFVLAHPFLPYAQTANAAFRREVFDRVGAFDEGLITGEDADFLWRMQLQTQYRLIYRPEAVVWHRHRGTARGLLRQTIGWGTGHALVYKKYRGVVPRDSWGRLLSDYRRILGLAGLSLRYWLAARSGRAGPDLLEEAYLSLLFEAGIRFGRWKGSVAARVLYP